MRESFKAVKRTRGAAGIDKVSIQMFEENLDANLTALPRDLKTRGSFVPKPLRRVWIPKDAKGKKLRPLGIPAVRDRVAQEVVRRLLAPIFEPLFHDCSFGFRPKRSCHQAIERLLSFHQAGYRVTLDADIAGFFDNIPHKLIVDAVAEEVADGNILNLIRKFLAAGVMENGVFKPTTIGTPQGGVISPLLANIVLNKLDGRLEQAGYRFVRYADDFVVVCRTRAEANAALARRLGIGFTLFADPKGKIAEGYGAEANAGAATAYVIDRNQRVLAVLRGPEGDCAGRALAFLESEVAAPPSHLVTAQAPVLLLPDVLEPEFCARLIEVWQGDHAEGAVRLKAPGASEAQTRAVDYSLKKRLDHRLDGPLNQDLSQRVMNRIGPEVMKSFQFRPHVLEKFCIAAYDAERGDYFRPHRDNTTPQTQDRRFAVTINLNQDYEGGGLRFPEFGDQSYRTAGGGAIVFSCSLLHEATPVTRGRRFAALSFMFGEEVLARAAAGVRHRT